MGDTNTGRVEQSREELEWGEPEFVPTHSGRHDPVVVDGEVKCAMCGAVAANGDVGSWPDGDDERW